MGEGPNGVDPKEDNYVVFPLLACCSLQLALCICCCHFLVLHKKTIPWALGMTIFDFYQNYSARELRCLFFVFKHNNTGQISGFPATRAEHICYRKSRKRKLNLTKFRFVQLWYAALRVHFHCGYS